MRYAVRNKVTGYYFRSASNTCDTTFPETTFTTVTTARQYARLEPTREVVSFEVNPTVVPDYRAFSVDVSFAPELNGLNGYNSILNAIQRALTAKPICELSGRVLKVTVDA